MRYHETLIMGSIVRVYEDGSVEVVSKPKVLSCPYMYKVYGVKRSCDDVVEYLVKLKIANYGLFTPRRRFDFGKMVLFGTSEIISWAMEKKLLDCAIVVCDGAGTVVARSSQLVQGIGAVMNGLLKTYPVPEVIESIEELGGMVLDRDTAVIDQVKGVLKAVEVGCKKMAVSVIGLRCWEVSEVRRVEEGLGVDVMVFSTCNTFAGVECVQHLEKADYVCTSANQMLRKALADKALIQLGVTIPVYILTKKAKNIMLEYLKDLNEKILIRRASLPYEEIYTAKCVECEWF